MIELFSRRPDYLTMIETRLTPVHVSEDTVSLSAILLDDEYYDLLKQGAVEVEGVSVLDLEYLVLFKMKAWLDLSARKAKGEHVDSKNIKKHRNDVLRLAANIDPDARLDIDGAVLQDVMEFIDQNKDDGIDVKTLGIRGARYEDLIDRLKNCYHNQ